MEAVYTYKSNWWGYIGKRVLIAVVAFFVISLMIFLLINLDLDGDIGLIPINPTPEMMELMKQYGFYDSIMTKYFEWMGGVFTGDLGQNFYDASYYLK